MLENADVGMDFVPPRWGESTTFAPINSCRKTDRKDRYGLALDKNRI
jgi:hypothetical protein